MKVTRFQMGGAAPENATPTAQEQGAQAQGGAEEQIAQMAQQIIQQLGPEASAMLAQIIMQMLQGATQESQGQPVMQRQGGKLVMIGRR